MRSAGGWAWAVALAVAAPAVAGDEPAAASRSGSVQKRAAAPRGWLDLGAHGRPGAVTAESLLDAPRFHSTIDVEAEAPKDLNTTMALWWQHYGLPDPAIYGQGSNYRPGSDVSPAINILPAIDWIADKIKERKNRK